MYCGRAWVDIGQVPTYGYATRRQHISLTVELNSLVFKRHKYINYVLALSSEVAGVEVIGLFRHN